MFPFIKILKFIGLVFALYFPLSAGMYYYASGSMDGYFDTKVANELAFASLLFIAINAIVLLIKNQFHNKNIQR